MGHHGGFADRIRLDGRFAFPIPEALASENAAPLLCGGATVYSPLRRWAKPSMRVGVVGIGGLGHLGLQFARAMGCEVTAISSSPDKEKEARSFGAHRFIATRETKALASAASSLDFILSTVFVTPDWDGLLGALRPNGMLCLVGATSEPLAVQAFGLLLGQKSVTGIGDRGPARDPGDARTSRPGTGSRRRRRCGPWPRRTPPSARCARARHGTGSSSPPDRTPSAAGRRPLGRPDGVE